MKEARKGVILFTRERLFRAEEPAGAKDVWQECAEWLGQGHGEEVIYNGT